MKTIEFDDFLKKNIEECFINSSHDVMIWKIEGELYEIIAEGECCSSSWFEHCDDVSVLKNSTLLGFETVGDPEKAEAVTTEVGPEHDIKVNMLRFTTDKGRCTIEFRNSSNGYYSGYTVIRRIHELPNNFSPMIQEF